MREYEQRLLSWQCARMFAIPADRVVVFPVVRRNVLRGNESVNLAGVASAAHLIDRETEIADVVSFSEIGNIELTRDGECVLECVVADSYTGLQIGTCLVYAPNGVISRIVRRERPAVDAVIN